MRRANLLLVGLLLVLLPCATSAATRTATPGTFLAVSRQLQPGDTLLLETGHYPYSFMPPSHTTIQAAPGAHPVFNPAGHGAIIGLSGVSQVTIEGLEFDLSRWHTAGVSCAKPNRPATHITVRGNMFRHLQDAAPGQQGGGAITTCWQYNTDWLIEGNTITEVAIGNGDPRKLVHGIYIHSERATVRNNVIDMGNSGGFGIHLWPPGATAGGVVDGNIVRRAGAGGVIVGGRGSVARDNQLYDNAYGAKVVGGGLLIHNRLIGNRGPCISPRSTGVSRDNVCERGPAPATPPSARPVPSATPPARLPVPTVDHTAGGQLWALWSLVLGDHAPPQHFVLTVEHTTGGPVPPPMHIPWAPCTALASARPGEYCAPIGCPPAGDYRFFVQAQYAAGLSDRSNLVTCRIEVGTCACHSPGVPVALRPPPTMPPGRPVPPLPPLPTVPPGVGLSAERPPLVQVSAEDLALQPVGELPTLPEIPAIPAPIHGI